MISGMMDGKIWFVVGIVFLFIFSFGCVAVEEKWDEMQMKLTYVGPQRKVVPTIGISVKEFDIEKFKGYGTEGIDYSNDDIFIAEIKVTQEEMKKIVVSILSSDLLKEYLEEESPEEPMLSFMLYDAREGKVIELLLDKEKAKELASLIIDSLEESQEVADYLKFYSS